MASLTEVMTGLAGLGSATVAYSLVEAGAFTTRFVQTSVLPAGNPDLKVLHLSDLHITPAQSRKINWVSRLHELEPDLVVVTGDFLAHQLAVPAVIEALGELLDRPGMFVLGSNDYYAPYLKSPLVYFKKNRRGQTKDVRLPTQDLIEALVDAGWHDLNNKQVQISVNDVLIHARGTDDPHINKDDYSIVAGPFNASAFALGVTHAPYLRVLESFAKDQADLVLAGHTHGGQICIPFYGALVTNCDLPTNQAKGLSSFGSNEMPIHVSAGVGTSPYTPVRLACRPEATLLTLRAKVSS
ncbi:MAG: metallophosphoesterase [Actinomycetales bacterium]|nr:metallophosphoesterase [Actinomycetales bacterium]